MPRAQHTHSWDPQDEKAVAEARKKFDQHIEDKATVYHVKREETKTTGNKMEEFDPEAGEFIALRPQQGG